MTDEDKKRIAEYMGWKYRCDLWGGIEYSRDKTDGFEQYYIVRFDLNDAGLCVQEMQKRGEWDGFFYFVWNRYRKSEKLLYKEVNEATFTALLFSADNFFNAFVQWRKTK